MKAADALTKQGYWMFRYRSYLPLFILIFALACMWTQRGIYSSENIWFDLFCLLLSLSGEAIRIVAVGFAPNRTSGRNTTKQVANQINQTGIYSVLRHPLYLGNFLMWMGIAIFSRIWWLVLLFFLIYWLYYERIILAEEDYLLGKFGDSYLQFTQRVNCIIPSLRNYTPNRYCFRIKKVLRQEYSSLYGLIITFLGVEVFQDWISGRGVYPQAHWILIGASFTLMYITLRALKKLTRILYHDPQREKIPGGE
jgi:protein-S-isoprenylcysteine O-methyltransferase Ste14